MSTYGEMRRRVATLIKPPEIDEIEMNLLDLPEAFERTGRSKRTAGVEVSGWDQFNRSLRGFRPNEFSILCGPTGAGKTTLLGTLFVNFIAQGVPSFCAPVEVGADAFVRKLASVVSGVPMHKLEQEWGDIRKKYMGTFFSNPSHTLSIYESRVGHMQLMCDLLHSYETRGTRIALVDNLNFMMTAGDTKNPNAETDRVIQDWIAFVKKVPIHVVMVMHPKKTDGGRVESEFDIKGSSTAVQEAQNVLLFNRLAENQMVPINAVPAFCRELKIAKCRENGRATGSRILLKLDDRSEAYSEGGLLG